MLSRTTPPRSLKDEEPLLLAARRPDWPQESIASVLFARRTGRVLIGGIVLKVVFAAIEAVGLGRIPWSIQLIVSIVIGAALAVVVWRALVLAKRRLLWRVRRKLILSYIFIGVVPAMLLIAFFLFAGFLLFFQLSAFLFRRAIDDMIADAQVIARSAAVEARRAGRREGVEEVLERKREAAHDRYPGLSLTAAGRTPDVAPATAGPWTHVDPPGKTPFWIDKATGFGGLVAFALPGAPTETVLAIRAVAYPENSDQAQAVIVDVPIDDAVLNELWRKTGIELQTIAVMPLEGRAAPPPPASETASATSVIAQQRAGHVPRWMGTSVSIFDYTDWETGKTGSLTLGMRVSLPDLYDRMSAAQGRVKEFSLGELFMVVLGVIAVLFLIIEVIAFAMGFALARSITGSIHQLFVGTQRVQQSDFAHRINIRTRDQLGELADSFNDMTGSIEGLLRQADEKKRLEEELRIAREIQMSLLPRGPMVMPGLSVTALCLPAREVGGDYYDFFPLSPTRLGVLIADVAGKGTSAALYMAELKGLMLSLSRIHQSPKKLLIDVNQIISAHLDTKSFITMTYAVIDLEARTLTYARAGHTPLIYLPAHETGRRQAKVLTPDGLVLGLRIEGVAAKFRELLQEATIELVAGDVFVFFTDGITEAMNDEKDLFGESRLQEIIEQHGDLPSDQLRERILREVEAFVGAADQHDDMTMILIKIETVGALTVEVAALPATAART